MEFLKKLLKGDPERGIDGDNPGRSIAFIPQGGLGNQLFLYGTALYLARLTGSRLICDLSKLSRDRLRNFELQHFRNSIDVLEHGSPQERPFHLARIFSFGQFRIDFEAGRKPENIIDDSENWQSAMLGEVFRIQARGRSRAQNWSVPTIDGYFQDFRPLENIRSELRQEISSLWNPSKWFESEKESLIGSGFLSIHIRLTDFKDSPGQNIVPNGYYQKALDVSRALHGDLPIVVFSDDIASAKEMKFLSGIEGVRFIHPQNSVGHSDALETLNLMAEASAAITANSTFSLWAAWLGEKNQDRVICPRPLSQKVLRDERFLVPPQWISVGYDASTD